MSLLHPNTTAEQAVSGNPKRSSLVAITAAIIGIIYGYDLGNISGALLFIPAEMKLNSTFLVESITTVVVIGSIVGALLGGPLANAIGRKATMVVVALAYAVFALLSAFSLPRPSTSVSGQWSGSMHRKASRRNCVRWVPRSC